MKSALIFTFNRNFNESCVFAKRESKKKKFFLCKRISAFQINTNLGQNLKNRNSEIMNKFNEAKMVGKKVF